MKNNKRKIIIPFIVVGILVFVFWYGGNAPGLRGWTPEQTKSENVIQTQSPAPSAEVKPEASQTSVPKPLASPEIISTCKPTESIIDAPVPTTYKEDRKYSVQAGMILNKETGKDKYMTDPVPAGKPLPIEPQEAVISDKEYTCNLSVRCDTILKNIKWLDNEKVNIVPADGVIFPETTVTFYEGESVFNLLLREMKRNNIHLEFENTPIYNSAYIEGIGNLYEFDCGELSGWMYKVNGWFPNYGCSRYQLKAGDKVEWVYTCDLGIDVDGYNSAAGE